MFSETNSESVVHSITEQPDASAHLTSTPQNQAVSVPNEMQQLTQFVDADPADMNMITSEMDSTFTSDQIDIGALKDFLSRPTLIHEQTLTLGTPSGYSSILPWHLYFNNAVIKRKIDNYAYISCKLHLKIMINSTPFLYGGVICTYEPLTDHGYNISTTTNPLQLVELTSAPHVWVFPQTNTGGEMVLPFFYDTDWLELTSASDLQAMGKLHIREAIALASANGSVGQSCTIQFYAWAEDVKLSGPTFESAVQSGWSSVGTKVFKAATSKGLDEYAKKPISSIASTIAAMARPLTKIPTIGIFAKATEIGASAVGSIASLFGFTNPPNIVDVLPVRNVPYHAMNSGSIKVPAETLALDPKQELCVDPRTVGLSEEDEMAISYIAGREAYVGEFNWDTTDAPEVDLFNIPVGPTNYQVMPNATSGYEYAMTPACMLSQNFKYWRGDIIFRFKFIASKYHCGRIRLVWDPKANLNTVPANTNTSLNRIVDISEETDVEVRIPFNQARHFLECPDLQIYEYLGVKGSIIGNYYNKELFNGNFHGYVLNSLSAPETTAGITVLMFARMAPNAEFTVPIAKLDGSHSYFAPQSGDMISISGASNDETDQNQYNVYFGEAVRSLRSVLRKAYPTAPMLTSATFTNTDKHCWVRWHSTIFPYFNGYDPTSNYFLRNQADSLNIRGTATLNTPFTLMVPCYKALRGSMFWHYEYDNTQFLNSTRVPIEISRNTNDPPVSGGIALIGSSSGLTATTGNINGIMRSEFLANSGNIFHEERNSQTVMTSNTLDGKSILFPNMFNYRFDTTRPSAMITGLNRPRTRNEYVTCTMRTTPFGDFPSAGIFETTVIRRYYAAGPDFSLFYLQCVPRFYKYTSFPLPGV